VAVLSLNIRNVFYGIQHQTHATGNQGPIGLDEEVIDQYK